MTIISVLINCVPKIKKIVVTAIVPSHHRLEDVENIHSRIMVITFVEKDILHPRV